MAKIQSPVFVDAIQKDCYRFIMEEECIKEDYKIGGKKYKEVEWEYDKEKGRILVYLNTRTTELVIPFFLERFPVLEQFLANISK